MKRFSDICRRNLARYLSSDHESTVADIVQSSHSAQIFDR